MNSSFVLNFFQRKNTGKFYNKDLRKSNKIPCVLYRKNISISALLDKTQVPDLLNNNIKPINSKFDNSSYNVILKSYLKHPFQDEILHFDFQIVEEDDIININVPIRFIDEKNCPGIKYGGYLIKYVRILNVRCLVKNIPSYIDISLSNLNVNNSIFLQDLDKNKDFIFTDSNKKNKFNLLIASVVGSRIDNKDKEIQKK